MDLQIRQAERITEIARLHEKVGGYVKSALSDAIKIGELLSEVKGELQHGEFEKWIDGNLPFSARTARNYMRLHRERDRIKTETVSDLTGAYRLVTDTRAVPVDDIQTKAKALRKEVDDLDESLPTAEQIRIVNEIIDRAQALQNTAAERHLRAQIQLGRMLREIEADRPGFDEFNAFCKAWGKIFQAYDQNPVGVLIELEKAGASQELMEWAFSEREEITAFPQKYADIKAAL